MSFTKRTWCISTDDPQPPKNTLSSSIRQSPLRSQKGTSISSHLPASTACHHIPISTYGLRMLPHYHRPHRRVAVYDRCCRERIAGRKGSQRSAVAVLSAARDAAASGYTALALLSPLKPVTLSRPSRSLGAFPGLRLGVRRQRWGCGRENLLAQWTSLAASDIVGCLEPRRGLYSGHEAVTIATGRKYDGRRSYRRRPSNTCVYHGLTRGWLRLASSRPLALGGVGNSTFDPAFSIQQ